MTKRIVIVLLVGVALAGCAGAPQSPEPAPESTVAAPSPVEIPILNCPPPPADAPKLKVIGQFVRLRAERKSLAKGVVVLGKIPYGEVVVLLDIRGSNWREVACGEHKGWVLMHNGKPGPDRRFRLQPVE